MLRKNGLVKLPDGQLGKIVQVKRETSRFSSGKASFSSTSIESVLVRLLDNQLLELTSNFGAIIPLTKKDLEVSVYEKLKELSSNAQDLEALDRVWKRQDEAKKIFIDEKSFAEVERLDVKTLRKIALDEGTTLELFIEYARKRQQREREQ